MTIPLRRSTSCFVFACLTTALAACGDDGEVVPPPMDGGTPDGGSPVAAPNIPWLAEGAPPLALTPCPEGWREVTDSEGVTTCDPYPAEGRADCAAGEAHFPGEPGCRPVGGACPTTTFADPPAGDTLVYVDASAADGGDGSASAPFDSLSDVGWSVLGTGTTVLLARGVYPGSINLRPGVRLLGACAAETVLSGDTTLVPAVVTASSAGDPARLERVAIRDVPKWGIFARGGATLHATGVIVDGAARGGVLTNERGSEIVLTDTLVQATRPGSDGLLGFGLEAAGGARITTERVVVADNHTLGVRATQPETTVSLVDTAIVGTRPGPGSGSSTGIELQQGATVVGERLFLADALFTNVAVVGSRLELTDSVLAAGESFAIFVDEGGSMRLTRVTASSTLETVGGLFLNEGCQGELEDVVLRDFDGWGLATVGGEVDVSRLVVERIDGFGVVAEATGARIALADSMVRDTSLPGLDAAGEGHLDASRVLVSRVIATGAMAVWGGRLTLADVVIRETLPAPGLGNRYGTGLIGFEQESVVSGERVVVENAYEMGVVAYPGARVSLTDLVVRGVSPSASGVDVRRSGFSVAVFSAEMTLERFHLSDGSACGLILAPAADPAHQYLPTALDAAEGLVEGMDVGACVQVDGYDLSRLQSSVIYRDNGTNLDVSDLPVPDGAEYVPDP